VTGVQTCALPIYAFREELARLGYSLPDHEINDAFERFKRLADQKKELFEEDLETIVSDAAIRVPERYSLHSLHVESGLNQSPTAIVELKMAGKFVKKTGSGDGPVDAVYRTIACLTETKSQLRAYIVKAITGGTDAQGEVSVRVEEEGETVTGHGSDTDIIIASAKAYLNALNKLAALTDRHGRAEEKIGLC
jgi:2-isopropylmalate synthase